jgi:hypothetical protein
MALTAAREMPARRASSACDHCRATRCWWTGLLAEIFSVAPTFRILGVKEYWVTAKGAMPANQLNAKKAQKRGQSTLAGCNRWRSAIFGVLLPRSCRPRSIAPHTTGMRERARFLKYKSGAVGNRQIGSAARNNGARPAQKLASGGLTGKNGILNKAGIWNHVPTHDDAASLEA